MKNKLRHQFLLLTIAIILVISACAPKPTPTPIGVYVETSVAATMQAQATVDSLRALEQRMTQMAMPTVTRVPTLAPLPTATVAQTLALPQPTSAPIVTKPPMVLPPANTATPIPAAICLKASLVNETIPDGTSKTAGEDFTKTWTFKNTGTCPWTTEFDFSFLSGEKMNAASIDLPQNVAPGGEITISILMEAPDKAGDFTGMWSFRDAGGKSFGVGASGTSNVSVRIVVN